MTDVFLNGWRTVEWNEEFGDVSVTHRAPWTYHKFREMTQLPALITNVITENPGLFYNRTVEYQYPDKHPRFEAEFSAVYLSLTAAKALSSHPRYEHMATAQSAADGEL